MRKVIIQETKHFFTCIDCGKTFSNETGLRLHNKAEHKINKGFQSDLKFYCNQCDITFDNRFQFGQHLNKIHKRCWRETCPHLK